MDTCVDCGDPLTLADHDIGRLGDDDRCPECMDTYMDEYADRELVYDRMERIQAGLAPNVTPEEQVDNVRNYLAYLRAQRRYRGRAEAIRTTQRQLEEMEAHPERLQTVSTELPF